MTSQTVSVFLLSWYIIIGKQSYIVINKIVVGIIILKYKKKDKNRVEEKCLVFDLGTPTPYIYNSVCMIKNKMKKYKTGESSLQETCTEKISFKCSNNRLNTLTTTTCI